MVLAVAQEFVQALRAQEFFTQEVVAVLVTEILAPTLKDLVRLAVVAALTLMEAVFLLLRVRQIQAAVAVAAGVQLQVQQAVLELSSFVTQLTALHPLLQQATLR
jgi:hypothetical protein